MTDSIFPLEVRLSLAAKALAAAQLRIQECRLLTRTYARADHDVDEFDRLEYMDHIAIELVRSSRLAYAALRVTYEAVGLTKALEAIENEIQSFAYTAGEVSYTEYTDEPVNVFIDFLSSNLDILTPLFETPSSVREQQHVLIRILRQFPQYVESVGVLPGREKDIGDQLESVLRLAFPDLIREPPIPQQTKVYHPDFGSEAIGTGIEIKFAKEKGGAISAMGGLYEDMKGYASSSYSLLVGVIYMTGNYITQEQVEAELRKVKTSKDWKVFVIVGMKGPATEGEAPARRYVRKIVAPKPKPKPKRKRGPSLPGKEGDQA